MRLKVCALTLLLTGVAAAAEPAKTMTVAADGTGDFKTLQEAVAAAGEQATIHLAAGDYRGPVVVPKEKKGLTVTGDGPDKSIITWDRNVYEPIPPGSDKFNPTFQVKADGFTAEN